MWSVDTERMKNDIFRECERLEISWAQFDFNEGFIVGIVTASSTTFSEVHKKLMMETLGAGFLEATHPGWDESPDYGTIIFDVADRTIYLTYNKAYVGYNTTEEQF